MAWVPSSKVIPAAAGNQNTEAHDGEQAREHAQHHGDDDGAPPLARLRHIVHCAPVVFSALARPPWRWCPLAAPPGPLVVALRLPRSSSRHLTPTNSDSSTKTLTPTQSSTVPLLQTPTNTHPDAIVRRNGILGDGVS